MRRPQPPDFDTKSFPAPVRGWIENENLVLNRGVGCSVLENGFPLPGTVRIRGGKLRRNNLGAAVASLVPWKAGNSAHFFASTTDDLFDITSAGTAEEGAEVWPGEEELWPGSEELWFGASGANLEAQTALLPGYGGAFSYVQTDTGSNAPFLVIANGTRSWAYYDGADWNPINTAAVNEVAYDGLVTAFAIGQTVTGATSGASATVLMVVVTGATTGVLRLGAITSGPFQDDENLQVSAVTKAVANGASAASSSVTVTGVATADLYPIWVHANRIWGVQEGTLQAWYLPVDAIGGAAAKLNLGGVFQEGGKLLYGATWSADSGSGMGDRCVFVSDQGEVAVYQGTDPSSANTWTKVGLYNVGNPVGKHVVKAGGDLLIPTTDGIVPLSAVVTKDPAALSMAAVTYPIEPAWKRVIASRTASDFVQLLKWQKESMMIVGYPHRGDAETHVVNLTTGAWARWSGHDITCMALHNDLAYFGSSDGYVHQFEAVGNDAGDPYVMRLCLLPDPLGAPGNHKQVHQARAIFRALAAFTPRLSVATDYRREFPAAPTAATIDSGSEAVWDSGVWDVARWDIGPDVETRATRSTRFKSIGRSGIAVSPQVQITSGSRRKPDAELVTLDLIYQVGDVVV